MKKNDIIAKQASIIYDNKERLEEIKDHIDALYDTWKRSGSPASFNGIIDLCNIIDATLGGYYGD